MDKKYLAKIIASDNEGLQMISACTAGAKIKVSDIKYLAENKVFLLSIERTKIETDQENKKEVEKVRTAAVLITDGGHNREGSPLETAKLLSARNLPIYTVGLGSDIRPPDFALLGSMVPDSVYQEDRVKGALSIKDHLVPGTPYQIIIQDEHNKTVWKKKYPKKLSEIKKFFLRNKIQIIEKVLFEGRKNNITDYFVYKKKDESFIILKSNDVIKKFGFKSK